MTTDTDHVIVEAPPEIVGRLFQARGRMPYGAMVHTPEYAERGYHSPFDSSAHLNRSATVDLTLVAEYLESLAEVLGTVAKENTAKAERLSAIEHDLAAAGRLLAMISGGDS